jgi:hypothetical protein
MGSSPRTAAMFGGTMTVAPRQRSGVVDVRDVADLHVRAMASTAAAGKRFLAVADGPALSFLELAGILRDRFGALAVRAPTREAPGEVPRGRSSTTIALARSCVGGRVRARRRSWRRRRVSAISVSLNRRSGTAPRSRSVGRRCPSPAAPPTGAPTRVRSPGGPRQRGSWSRSCSWRRGTRRLARSPPRWPAG